MSYVIGVGPDICMRSSVHLASISWPRKGGVSFFGIKHVIGSFAVLYLRLPRKVPGSSLVALHDDQYGCLHVIIVD